MAHDERFAREFEAARQAAADTLEAGCRRRDQLGVDESVCYRGTVSLASAATRPASQHVRLKRIVGGELAIGLPLVHPVPLSLEYVAGVM